MSNPIDIKEPRLHDWHEKLAIGELGVNLVIDFLNSDTCRTHWNRTELVHSVARDKRYYEHDIDLLWVIPEREFLRCETIEVKADNTLSNNLFCEVVSVEEDGRKGNIVVTRAEWLFYCFLATRQIFCLPMAQFRPWFLKNEETFDKRSVKSINQESNSRWTSVGRLVPYARVFDEVHGVRAFERLEPTYSKPNNDWLEIRSIEQTGDLIATSF